MTDLKKPVSRVSKGTKGMVFEAGKMRPIVITLVPPCILKFRPKGCRKSYSLTTDVCYSMAVKADVAEKKRAKQREKKKQPKRKKR